MIVTVYKVIVALALAAVLTFVDSFDLEFYGTPVRILNGFVSDNISKTLPAISYLQCLRMCMKDSDCQGVFFHPLDEVCMLTQYKHYNTNGLQSYPGMQYFQTQPSSCSEWLLIGQANSSGNKQIDLDGRKDQFGPRTIWCDFTTEPGKAVTVLRSVSFPKYCDCSQTDTCSHSSGCNCVFNDDAWKYDEGFVTNKDDLPITGFRAGDTGSNNEYAYHTIGPLICL